MKTKIFIFFNECLKLLYFISLETRKLDVKMWELLRKFNDI
ncbi:hypothetical protein LEP1GSC107_2286 [Leptospira interrogans serovar Grippotyphosa str. UI 12769]|uniref:Uncharacterized protein n=3 Tax=Leptospira interrogans TaxID=173 RepID=M6KT21_LEPIR|nr:hypothetical protein LEP1GSC020_1806 [Leptospira interrogans serovar Grippotyphosa str. 2006006986]EKR43068.1 hypothetical protein LEP1GSC097_0508 [Leptospira interrogans serovar Grippotyphosa str. UI 08368]EMJ38560.1 hypothetical protein LEP1GSC079_1728 [Leptospira interrogans str. FPW1039]EMK20912.1 hypothetical protein LEP1GSC075_3848 [Leptospira interrogans str. Kito]EMM96789.1 hypothetical protein LEP1GSC158_1528 [Leptospira interrogans serovar Zanoni str. LT2156]EMN30947.1 hypothetica